MNQTYQNVNNTIFLKNSKCKLTQIFIFFMKVIYNILYNIKK